MRLVTTGVLGCVLLSFAGCGGEPETAVEPEAPVQQEADNKKPTPGQYGALRDREVPETDPLPDQAAADLKADMQAAQQALDAAMRRLSAAQMENTEALQKVNAAERTGDALASMVAQVKAEEGGVGLIKEKLADAEPQEIVALRSELRVREDTLAEMRKVMANFEVLDLEAAQADFDEASKSLEQAKQDAKLATEAQEKAEAALMDYVNNARR